jgi:hypothetical protein
VPWIYSASPHAVPGGRPLQACSRSGQAHEMNFDNFAVPLELLGGIGCQSQRLVLRLVRAFVAAAVFCDNAFRTWAANRWGRSYNR